MIACSTKIIAQSQGIRRNCRRARARRRLHRTPEQALKRKIPWDGAAGKVKPGKVSVETFQVFAFTRATKILQLPSSNSKRPAPPSGPSITTTPAVKDTPSSRIIAAKRGFAALL